MVDSVGVVCNAGACTNVDPATALIIIALDALARELQGKDPFGPNNAIVKALKDAQRAALEGDIENNDILKALQTSWSDLTKGMGPNHDVRRALEAIGLRF
jgi:hypothetical protein